ncbi:FHA domain-containing protein [Streptomyces sp. NY05-11A]|uniref:FHA domain-containing protein n=1 Tax=Streptomyces soliscabiei TaxID=588897 RepID=UPI0029A875C2|nr:FHA domain-containing protein [Streptomyces sp. NY05-11A]MDX2680897.1 FHA domain-containing protein [Streptomyces sp. NY05-11A]
MQIRLTVVDPQGPHPEARGRAASCDVLVTAPAGTALAAVASALAAAVSGEGAASSSSAAALVLYAGVERLDAQRCTLGEPPLIDGAVLSLGAPADPEPHPEVDDAPARLHVVAGPDAGGVHLLHGGQVRVGRSADADVPLDDPDVSRLHCAVTLSPDGRLTVADLGSTNGTTLDGTRVPSRPVRLAPGALLRIGESALRLAPPGGPGPRVATTPDGEGHVRVPCGGTDAAAARHTRVPGAGEPAGTTGPAPARVPGATTPASGGSAPATSDPVGRAGPSGPTGHAYGTVDWSGSADARGERPRGSRETPLVPDQGTAPRIESRRGDSTARTTDAGRRPPPGAVPPGGTSAAGGAAMDASATHGGRSGLGSFTTADDDVRGPHTSPASRASRTPQHPSAATPASPASPYDGSDDVPDTDPRSASRRKGTPLRGTDVPPGVRRRGGLSAWARRLAGGRGGDQETAAPGEHDDEPAGIEALPSAAAASPAPETWPDPAALLLTALGPGPRLWERGPGHPEALTVRLGTADRPAPDGSGLLPAVPVTAGLREVGALGLAGPRPRLSGLARAVLAQLAALHSPDALEVVLISADRARSEEERVAEWSWLGWLPQLRPGHGQDCRLLLAYDRDQATARTDELLRRLQDHLSDSPSVADSATAPAHVPTPRGTERRPSWAVADDTTDGGFPGPYTVLVVDGDPGGADLREAVSRLALAGPRAGIHVVCLAETPAASPAAPVTQMYEAACAAAPTFRACGAVALLSGDVATALRLLRVARAGAETERPGPVGAGTVGAVDAVSLAWAERFARALAPLRPDGSGGGGELHTRVSAPLPQSARLLDELGLARATPASLMARWADAADDSEALGGRVRAVLGAGPRGPVGVDLVAEGPHLLIEGPTGSGRTELLRAVVASLAAAERPDRLGVILLDGRDTVGKGGGGPGDGLQVCTDVPHVTTHLTANDPVRMREFAQSLSAELKRRAELLGRSHFAEWHTHRAVSGRIVPQRTANTPPPGTGPGNNAASGAASGAADLEAPPSTTLRLRPGAAARQRTETVSPLPRLVVVVDDLDALVAPALGSPGRPAAGSVMRALEAVAREGERLGVHLVAAAGPGGRTAESEPARMSTVRITLDPPGSGTDEPAPGRGRLKGADGRLTPFQGGRVTGRIPRTATLRPTVVPLEWPRMGDPPTRRPVRELGNGPTDLALLASALERAARQLAQFSPSGV